MKKHFVHSLVIAVLVAASCNGPGDPQPLGATDHLRDRSYAEYITDDEPEDTQPNANITATTTRLYYQLVTQDVDFAQRYDLKYWVYPLDQEPALDSIKSDSLRYYQPEGQIRKRGLL